MLISICIPTYRQLPILFNLLKTIDFQTFRDFEVIISDDSPDDELEQAILSANWTFPIRYYRNNPAKGSPQNWNHVISLAQGEWIKIMHHDDWFYDADSLKYFAEAISQNPETDFFFCQSWVSNGKKNEDYIYRPNSDKLRNVSKFPADLFEANLIGAPSATMYKKTMKLQYDSKLMWLVDIEFFCRVIQAYKIQPIERGLIVTSEFQAHQLTYTLRDNKATEIREYLYCYEQLCGIFNPVNRAILRRRIIHLFLQFEVKSIKEIRDAGYIGRIPGFVRLYTSLMNFNAGLAQKVIGKWTYLQLKHYDYN
ncbi:MAG TPA: glycosyltransferase family 2 protein [Flavobacteriales bacterium]|nr:glycosyltransferase family 2 protein [Flavobacteriales bacterium]HPH80992.1 glycosyltransferase family 2 protein [Flavobacteriales bacterium]